MKFGQSFYIAKLFHHCLMSLHIVTSVKINKYFVHRIIFQNEIILYRIASSIFLKHRLQTLQLN